MPNKGLRLDAFSPVSIIPPTPPYVEMHGRHVTRSPNLQTLLKTPRNITSSSWPRRYTQSRQFINPQNTTIPLRSLSDLGVRSQRPPDSLPENEPQHQPDITDEEWLIRTGRATFVLQETFPDFFKTGLYTSVDKATGAPVSPTSPLIPSAAVNFLEHTILDRDDEEPIYSRDIRLSYTPPTELPAPFPRTFHIDGLQMYLASSSLLRHTMSALYTDLVVANLKLAVDTPPSIGNSAAPVPLRKRGLSREKSILLRQSVTGVARMTGKPVEWEIESIFTFSPISGLIHRHVVNSIRPTPHQAVYDALRGSLGKLLGIEWPGSSPTPGSAAFKGTVENGAREGPSWPSSGNV